MIDLDRRSGVALLTLNAPGRRNALTVGMAEALIAACEEIDADESVGAVVVRGAGGYFCSGGDRATLADAGTDPAEGERYAGMTTIYRSFARVGELLAPTIAAITGGAVGAGLNLALATDLRVVAEDAVLLSGFLPIQAVRGIVSYGLNALPPLRRLVMRIGMEPPTELPSLMRPPPH